MAAAGDIALRVRSDPRLLHAVRGMVRCYVRSHGFEQELTENIVLAVDEACANSMRHAYAGRDDGEVVLRLNVAQDTLCVDVEDHGSPVPQGRWEKRIEEPPANPEDLTPGGLGFPLMHAIFDTVEVLPGEASGNCVRLRLRRPQPGDV